MFCKVCKEFYSDKKTTVTVQGRALGQVDKFIQVRFKILFSYIGRLVFALQKVGRSPGNEVGNILQVLTSSQGFFLWTFKLSLAAKVSEH